MKKFIYSLIILTSISLLFSCKTSSHIKCDSYGFNTYSDSIDIDVINWESQKKYSTVSTVKL